MLEIIFLGTGAGVPAKERNVTSVALQLLEERGATWLFDCGEATQHQILYTSIRPRRIEKIFITHLHGDHIFGLPGLLGSRSFQGGESLLTVYGPIGIKAFIETTLSVSTTHLRYPLEIIEIEEGVVFEDDQFTVMAMKLDHGIQSFGYRVIEKDLPGKLLVEKLKGIGIQPGPIYQQLKAGEVVTLEDGRVVNGNDFLGEKRTGRVIAIVGDTRICDNCYKVATDATILIHEATFCAGDEKFAYDYFHSTTKQAAKVAHTANVKTLLLTHISSRYQGNDVELLLKEAKEIFEHTYIASDLLCFKVPQEME